MKLSQTQVARMMNSTEQFVSEFENGKNNFEFDMMLDFATAIKLPLCKVFPEKLYSKATILLARARKGNVL